MTQADAPLGQSLGTGGGHVLGLRDLEDLGTERTDHQGDDPESDRQRSEEKRFDVPGDAFAETGRRQQLRFDGQVLDQDQAEPEAGDAEAGDGDDADDLVAQGAGLGGRPEGERHGEEDDEDRRVDDQPDRHRQPFDHQRAGRAAVAQRGSEVAGDEPFDEEAVLVGKGSVEPPLVMKAFDRLRGGVGAERRPRRVSRNQVDQEEHHDGHPDHHRDRLQEAPDQEARVGHPACIRRMASIPISSFIPSPSLGTPPRRRHRDQA